MSYLLARPMHPQFNPAKQTGLIVSVITGKCKYNCPWCITKAQRKRVPEQPEQLPIENMLVGIDELVPYTEIFSLQGDEIAQENTWPEAAKCLPVPQKMTY